MNFSTQTWAKLAALFSGLVFGIYWIPLRLLDQAGLPSLWAVMLFNMIAFIAVSPVVIIRFRELFPGRLRLHRNTLLAAIGFICYATGLLYTEVVRAIVLFYLMPIWGFLIARVLIGELITPIRWVSMALGLVGLMAICGFENGFPLPNNLGDWLSFSAGIIWAYVSTDILMDKQDATNYTLAFLFWSAVIGLIVAITATKTGGLPPPQWHALSSVLIWLIPFAILGIIPGAFATLYGPSQLNPGVVGLLFMVEVGVGTLTAVLFSGEAMGLSEALGVLFIMLAGVAEPCYGLFTRIMKR